ncbi:beta-lactamase/transpeptidase-like protein [Trichoderma austrokoningii]
MAQVQGHYDPKFEELRKLFQKNLDSKADVGASITVNIDGKNVADIWGGYVDEECTRPWEADTLVAVWSCTKGVASLALLMLIDRGLVEANAKVAQYWPEFAANGKQDIEIRHLLSHTSGLSAWEEEITIEQLPDQDTIAAKLAAQAPLWEPGTASGYHAATFGVLIAEVLRRVTGKTMKQFVAEEIAAPLGADFQIGLSNKDVSRTSNSIAPKDQLPTQAMPEPGSIPFKTFTNPVLSPNFVNTETVRKADVSSFNGFANARAMNRIYSTLALGGRVDGVQLLSQKTIDLIFQEQSDGIDLVSGFPMAFGIGYALGGRGAANFMPGGRVGCWGGWGGSLFIFDVDRKLTFTYAMNQMSNNIMEKGREGEYVKAVYKALGVELE